MFAVGNKVFMRGLTMPNGLQIACTVVEVLPHDQYRLTWRTYGDNPIDGGGTFPGAILSHAGLITAYKGK